MNASTIDIRFQIRNGFEHQNFSAKKVSATKEEQEK